MPEERLAKARQGYDGYVYQPPQPEPTIVVTDNGFTANVIEGEAFDTDCDPADETPWAV